MSYIKALGYIGLNVSDLQAWKSFAIDTLGVMLADQRDDQIDLRIDDYSWRIRLCNNPGDDLAFAGWEVANSKDLRSLRQQLEAAGLKVNIGSKDLAEDRAVSELIWFEDPDGLRVEAFCGPLQRSDIPFASRYGTRFNTGSQGLGHIVFATRDSEAMRTFYESVLGFKISDYINTEVVKGRPLSITFLRCNSRHHSLALAPVPSPKRLVHFMLETQDIDSVGRAMYRSMDEGRHLSFTLGRHSNDQMLSFYILTPSGFDLEYGWGGLEVDDDTWHIKTHKTNSAWGHKFQRPPKPEERNG